MMGSFAQAQQKQKIETRTTAKHIAALTIAAATALFALLGGAVLHAKGQDKDKYSLRSPGGIAFSDFRGYEDWSVVSSAHTEEALKVIVANPAMIKAYQAGVPGIGKLFPVGAPQNAAEYPSVKVVIVFSKFDRKTLKFMGEAVPEGKLVIPISRKLPLSEAAEAHAAADKGGSGKILVA